LESVDYYEIRTGGAAPDERLPMVIALHSRGMTSERMAEFASHLPGKLRVIVPDGFEKAALGRAWTKASQGDPSYAVELQDVAAELIGFIDGIRQCRPTIGRPIVAGYSAGADLAFALAADAGDYIGGAVGAAGWLPPGLGPVVSPSKAIHGRDDKAVPYERTSLEVATRIGKGEPITMVPLSNVGHSFAGALQLKWLEAVAKAASSPT
jgi:phospholipase/carboxylesterase